MRKRMLVIAILILVVAMFVGCQEESQYPDKQVTVVVPYSPGGASDTVARIFASEMEAILDVPFVATNKTGASGSVGLEYAKNSDPDGYTIAYMPVESTMLNALGFTDLTTDDFKFIARAMTIPASVTVRSDSPWNTLEELLADIKENPETIKCGNSGTGSIWHIAAAQVELAAEGKFVHVPFDGAAPAIAALMGENIDVVTVSPSEVKSGVDSGDLKVLAVLGDKPSSVVPDVPTATDLGIDIVVQAWGGFAVPADTPDEIVKVLEDAAEQAIDSQNLKDLLADRGFEHNYLNGSDMDATAKKELAFYSELIPQLGIKE